MTEESIREEKADRFFSFFLLHHDDIFCALPGADERNASVLNARQAWKRKSKAAKAVASPPSK